MTASENSEDKKPASGLGGFIRNRKTEIGLGVLILYVLLLGLGTIGELWDVEWILDLPLFRPPGKYQ